MKPSVRDWGNLDLRPQRPKIDPLPGVWSRCGPRLASLPEDAEDAKADADEKGDPTFGARRNEQTSHGAAV